MCVAPLPYVRRTLAHANALVLIDRCYQCRLHHMRSHSRRSLHLSPSSLQRHMRNVFQPCRSYHLVGNTFSSVWKQRVHTLCCSAQSRRCKGKQIVVLLLILLELVQVGIAARARQLGWENSREGRLSGPSPYVVWDSNEVRSECECRRSSHSDSLVYQSRSGRPCNLGAFSGGRFHGCHFQVQDGATGVNDDLASVGRVLCRVEHSGSETIPRSRV